jgi:hypothetical protein
MEWELVKCRNGNVEHQKNAHGCIRKTYGFVVADKLTIGVAYKYITFFFCV